MGLMSASVAFIFILIFGSISISLEIGLGIFSFVLSLAVSRLFDVQIVKVTKLVLMLLDNHKNIRDFVLKHF